MITAQDIREKCFEKARIGGYAMDEVDDFLDELANDAAASQKEIATLNAKMKYLADKIREYQGSEEAMNMALVSAQKLAKNIEEDARAKAEALVASAQKEADDILAAAKAESDRTIGAIEANRKAEELRYEKARAAAAGRRAPQTRHRPRPRSIVEPRLGGEAALGVPFGGGLGRDRDAEGPDMPLGILRAVGAVAVELRFGFGDDVGARCARLLAMRVDILALAQLDMHRLRIFSAEVRGAAVIVGPFIADHDR